MANWTNHSVLSLSRAVDPIAEITRVAREVVLDALEEGWSGPPYDPFALAGILGIRTSPSDDVLDARVSAADDRFLIEYNPNKPRGRTRFSIAHEIGHTLFPDCSEWVRNRVTLAQAERDEW